VVGGTQHFRFSSMSYSCRGNMGSPQTRMLSADDMRNCEYTERWTIRQWLYAVRKAASVEHCKVEVESETYPDPRVSRRLDKLANLVGTSDNCNNGHPLAGERTLPDCIVLVQRTHAISVQAYAGGFGYAV
jgi:hypothetical protein